MNYIHNGWCGHMILTQTIPSVLFSIGAKVSVYNACAVQIQKFITLRPSNGDHNPTVTLELKTKDYKRQKKI